MKLSQAQFDCIKDCLPRQRGNVKMDNLQVINAILYVAENGCKWRRLPERFGPWHSIYTRMSRWSKGEVMDRLFARLQKERFMEVKIQAVSLDSTTIKAHPDAAGALKKRGPNALAPQGEDEGPRFIWLPRLIGLP